MDKCLGCLYASGEETPTGGVIARTENWMINHCVGPLGVGTLVIAPTRHVTRVSELTESEVVELGRLIQRACQVVEDLVAPEQTYVCLWSHSPDGPSHLHWVSRSLLHRRRNRPDASGTSWGRIWHVADQREIWGEGVTLRPTRDADLPALHRLFTDPGFYEYWDGYPRVTKNSSRSTRDTAAPPSSASS